MDSIVYLRKKLELLKEIRDLTENTFFLGGEEDAEAYTTLMEKREGIMEDLVLIDQRLEALDESENQSGNNEELRKEAKLIKSSISEMASQIISLDTEMSKLIPQITAEIKKHMKELSAGKNASAAYHSAGYYSSFSDGAGFDRKK